MLAPEAPYPLAGGGSLRTASLLHYLADRYTVDLIVFRQPGAPDPAMAIPRGLVRHLAAIPLPAHGRSAASRAIRNALRLARGVPPLVDRFAGFEAEIARALGGRRYEVGVIEHSWCAGYLPQMAEACGRTVLDLHNIESVWHARCAAVEPGAVGLAHRVFRRASLAWERQWLPRFSLVLATSEADRRLIAAIAPDARLSVYPNAIPLVPRPVVEPENVVIFSGNLEYDPNYAAVRFFRADIWPRLREQWPGLVWRLIGKNPEAVAGLVAGDPRIDLRGPVADAVGELARARVAVVPLLAGSGTRLKILEAWAAGVPVVSTTLGAEGLPARHGEHLLLADGAADFAGAVSRLLACKNLRESLGGAGRLLLEKEFTWDRAWQSLNI
jgi:polysaccharide biosynthesis protein PslH